MFVATATAPVNIATLKYWGKRDKALNLPTNPSISVTLSQDDLRTVTTSCASESIEKDQLWLNGSLEDPSQSARLASVLKELRRLRAEVEAADDSLPKIADLKLRIVSENNFPTAAGLASSAAGYAALVASVSRLYQLPQSAEELSKVARQGSGSACRSLMGGYVAWEAGEKADGSDSKALQIAPESHWPEMRAAILVVSADKKDVPSTAGMQATVATSELFAHRVKETVPVHYTKMAQAIKDRDFESFAELTMQESNQFHAVCLDTVPPIFYLNDTSRAATRAVNEINKAAGKTIAAYTFDAGPNAVIYYQQADEQKVLGPLKMALGHLHGWDNRPDVYSENEGVDERPFSVLSKGVSRVILTKVGEGPQTLDTHLINDQGQPILNH